MLAAAFSKEVLFYYIVHMDQTHIIFHRNKYRLGNHHILLYNQRQAFQSSARGVGIPITLSFIKSMTNAAVQEKDLPPRPSPVKGL